MTVPMTVPTTLKEILKQLESLGDDTRRKHNIKNGAPENQFGVQLGDIRAIAKKLKTNHELALTGPCPRVARRPTSRCGSISW